MKVIVVASDVSRLLTAYDFNIFVNHMLEFFLHFAGNLCTMLSSFNPPFEQKSTDQLSPYHFRVLWALGKRNP